MNQPLIDAYLDELLAPVNGDARVATPASASREMDAKAAHAEAAHVAVDAAADALAAALIGQFDPADAGPPAAEVPAAAANEATGEPAGAGEATAPGSDATPDTVETVPERALAAPSFDADALTAALLEEFDREVAAAAWCAPAPPLAPAAAHASAPAAPDSGAADGQATAPSFGADTLAAELLAEFDREFGAAQTLPAAGPAVPAPPVPVPVSEPAPAPAAAEFELPESFAPIPTPTLRGPATPAPSPAPALRGKAARARGVARPGRWLRVCVDADRYAIELLRVQEVVRVAPIVAMRGADPAVLGVMNLRGRIVPVFDLGLWLGTRAVDPDERSRIVVVERDDELIGLLATAVNDVVTLTAEHIEPPFGAGHPGAVVGVARADEAPTVLLDANWLFD